jgi:hypothetical protein
VARGVDRLIAEIKFIVEHARRVAGVRFDGETIVVLVADGKDRFEIRLPAAIRNRAVLDLGALVDMEIVRSDVAVVARA